MKLFKREIEDSYIQKNFIDIEDFINEESLLKGKFKFFEVPWYSASYPATVSFKHNLGYAPKDVLVTSKKGSGNYVMTFDSFTNTHIYATITGPVTLRMFLGTYAEGR